MVTHPLLFSGSELSRERALKNIGTILSKSQAPSGFFYGMGDGSNWFSDGFMKPHPSNMHLIRKSGDALYFLLKQFLALRQMQQSVFIKPGWETAIERLSDAFVSLWKQYGQLGQFVDIETGNLLVGGSTCGAIVPAGLVLAGRYFKNQAYLDIAEEIGADYLRQFRETGITTGGPGEILQAPDSESAFALLESMVLLFEETGNSNWLLGAEEVAYLCMTWCVSYDYQFPKDSLFNKLNIRTAGAVYANAQNKHAAPGICTLSGDSLLKLYRFTGKDKYANQLRLISHNLTQYVSRQDRPVGMLKPGWVNERVNMSDWEGKEMVGQVHNMSCWPEVSCMLTWQEIPGLYVCPDLGKAFCFDNIKMKIDQNDSDLLVLELINPTRFTAEVRMLIESSQDISKTLDTASILKPSIICLKPAETKKVIFRKDRQDIETGTHFKIMEITASKKQQKHGLDANKVELL